MRCEFSEFPDDEMMRGEIERNFGLRELDYLDRLLAGNIDYLDRLSRHLTLRIIFFLDLVSLAMLGQASHKFRELCSCDAVWSKIYMEHTETPPTQDLLMLVDQEGWRAVFFMNKLQLQKNMRRQGRKEKEQRSQFFLTSEEEVPS